MSNSNNNTGIIVAFHIGRGGQFHNAGHTTFIGERKISDFTQDLFVNYSKAPQIAAKIDGRDNLESLLNVALEDSSEGEAARARFEKWGFDFGEEIYVSAAGNEVGLTVAEAATGVGTINIDNQYDTTTAIYLRDCGENDLLHILNSKEWNKESLLQSFFDDCTDLKLDWKQFNGNYAALISDYFGYPNINIEEYYTADQHAD